ncbi:MAG: A24 family peptidase, partial [Hungatella sp.]
IGGGDVKLMAACGLLLGWRCSILTLILGCMLGSVIHIARMVISHADHVLAMGPYLSAAMFFSALWGEQMIHAYVRIFF